MLYVRVELCLVSCRMLVIGVEEVAPLSSVCLEIGTQPCSEPLNLVSGVPLNLAVLQPYVACRCRGCDTEDRVQYDP